MQRSGLKRLEMGNPIQDKRMCSLQVLNFKEKLFLLAY
jgi:hypothetical protein